MVCFWIDKETIPIIGYQCISDQPEIGDFTHINYGKLRYRVPNTVSPVNVNNAKRRWFEGCYITISVLNPLKFY